MPTQDEFQSLLNFQGGKKSALTIYIQNTKGILNSRQIQTVFKNLVKKLGIKERKNFHAQLNSIKIMLQSTPINSKGIALFVTKEKIYVYQLPQIPIENLILISDKFILYPLSYIRQYCLPVLLTTVQKNELSLYKISNNVKRLLTVKRRKEKRRDRLGFFSKFTGGGGTSEEGAKALEEIHTFMKHGAIQIKARIEEEKRKFGKEKFLEVVAGDGSSLKFFSQYISKTIPIKVSILQKILGYKDEKFFWNLAHDVNIKSVHEAVKRIVEKVKSQDEKSAKYLSDVISGLNEGKIMAVVMAINKPISGTVCNFCGYISAAKTNNCPACHKKVIPQNDIKEEIYRKCLKTVDEVWLTTQKLPGDTEAVAVFRY